MGWQTVLIAVSFFQNKSDLTVNISETYLQPKMLFCFYFLKKMLKLTKKEKLNNLIKEKKKSRKSRIFLEAFKNNQFKRWITFMSQTCVLCTWLRPVLLHILRSSTLSQEYLWITKFENTVFNIYVQSSHCDIFQWDMGSNSPICLPVFLLYTNLT